MLARHHKAILSTQCEEDEAFVRCGWRDTRKASSEGCCIRMLAWIFLWKSALMYGIDDVIVLEL